MVRKVCCLDELGKVVVCVCICACNLVCVDMDVNQCVQFVCERECVCVRE